MPFRPEVLPEVLLEVGPEVVPEVGPEVLLGGPPGPAQGLHELFEGLIELFNLFELVCVFEGRDEALLVLVGEFANLYVLVGVVLPGGEQLLRALVLELLEGVLILLEFACKFYLLHLEGLDLVAEGLDEVALVLQLALEVLLLLGLGPVLLQLDLEVIDPLGEFGGGVELAALLLQQLAPLLLNFRYLLVVLLPHLQQQLQLQLHLVLRHLLQHLLLLAYARLH